MEEPGRPSHRPRPGAPRCAPRSDRCAADRRHTRQRRTRRAPPGAWRHRGGCRRRARRRACSTVVSVRSGADRSDRDWRGSAGVRRPVRTVASAPEAILHQGMSRVRVFRHYKFNATDCVSRVAKSRPAAAPATNTAVIENSDPCHVAFSRLEGRLQDVQRRAG